ncbi:MAG: ribbon-helix-helix protein, CopG family [Aridibacter famidurans]|nr:ribbon-helix-helix protein, CopG family [Aridibacter famidurans]
MGNTTVNISLPESMKAQVEEIVASEGYGNTSEFFRELVRDYFRKRQEQTLEGMILEAIRNNDFAPLGKHDFEGMKKELEKRIGSRDTKSDP